VESPAWLDSLRKSTAEGEAVRYQQPCRSE
jgi:hypothetical protein